MNVLTVEHVSRSFGERVVLNDINFGLARGDKRALIAKNGSGKSTLMKIMAGLEPADQGQVVIREGIRIGFLHQEPNFDSEASLEEVMLPRNGQFNAVISRYRNALEAGDSSEMASAATEMDNLQAWEVEAKMQEAAAKLGLPDLKAKVGSLSGGQKRRLALAGMLLEQPDLLLLDEPTNHLDIPMIEWLEETLSVPSLTLLLVTHDRYFLDSVCTGILELDNGKLYTYQGDYANFLEKKTQRHLAEDSEAAKNRNRFESELEWVRKMPKARSTKSKSRLNAFETLKEKARFRRNDSQLELEVPMKRLGSKILEAIKISKNFGNKHLFGPFSYSFRKGERIAIVGDNGTGKTSMLKILTGQLPTDTGKVIVGETVEFGYFSQDSAELPGDKRIIEYVKETAEYFDNQRKGRVTASQLLTRFDFPPSVQYTYISKLSGGERRRLALLHMLLRQPNFLILDEPTNDLDVLTLQKLEEYLDDFGGCIIMVSHDRFFVDRIADQLIVLDGKGGCSVFGGSFTAYREELKEGAASKSSQPQEENQQPIAVQKTKTKLSYQQKRMLEMLPNEIEALEAEKSQLEEQLLITNQTYETLNNLSEALASISSKIEEKMALWLELEEEANGYS
ncbi:MAG: ABC-F family ATP-binding cassette domain-containing protein [Bacteroidetes bacterium]|nr:ABC-F family ATP-binding cassette domain-containing protein [Bacteroidota bacterium]